MKIKAYAEGHIVELEDGSRWRIFPGDLDITVLWKPETHLTVSKLGDGTPSHALVSKDGPVRVILADENRLWKR
ncbi:hypothetical protein [Bradyrhizobium sp. 76]|jgi:hypothetical protein|uniref:hypothetical protein n=1 Tax=Bradyrhizobium sp. 76 TaxID=2782680 RepID=UPI001FFAECD1|nr:hypothetical protein [Bradyrhizobium sp. 76]MCK1406139.1 hypothetical protein [Bradyrhizobium sp. 76]